eukprot:3025936-Alexandrium_andersonii.AAC.1
MTWPLRCEHLLGGVEGSANFVSVEPPSASLNPVKILSRFGRHLVDAPDTLQAWSVGPFALLPAWLALVHSL